MFFLHEKDSRFNPLIIHKSVFLIRHVPIENMGIESFEVMIYLSEQVKSHGQHTYI